VTIEGDMLTGVVTMALHELGDLRFLPPVDAFDERNAERAVVDAPDLHTAVRIVGPDVIDSIYQRPAFDIDVEPRPLLDSALRTSVGDMVDFPQE
jgi:hypothetical protein